MKKWTAWLLVLAMICTIMPFSTASAEEGLLYIPTDTEVIEEEAFANNISITSAFIPENVREIGANAFAGCTALQEIYFDVQGPITIAPDAFARCGDIHFVVYPDTDAELFALAHGYLCDRAEPGTTFFERIKQLVAEHGGTSVLQDDFDSMRLIVRRGSNRLPDISEYNPTEIVRRGDVFIIQFDTVSNTRACFGLLYNDQMENGGSEDFVEVDCCVTASFSSDDVVAAGVIDPSGWGTDDPMGFDVYAPYIADARNSSGARTIAVIDSGVMEHASYSHRLDRAAAMNMLDDGESWTADSKGHGSYIASVISECVGDARVSILPIRVIGSGNTYNTGNLDYVLLGNAILYAAEAGADIINLSMSFSRSAYVEMCINEAIRAGVMVVVAAGNSGAEISANTFPANLPQVVTVAGLQSDGTIAGNYGTTVDYVAPYSLFDTAQGVNRGTSFSAPMIASALALVSMDKYHTIDDMNKTCINGNETGSGSNSFGLGMPQLQELAKVPVLSITLDGTMPGELPIGSELELKWTIEPENATDKTVSVTSSDESILKVENRENGSVYLIPQGQGNATITVVPNGGPSLSVSRTFTVVQPVVTITIQGAKDRLAIGKAMKLTAILSPEDATTKTVEWITSDESVASVDADGTVRGMKEGSAAVYARALDGYGAQSQPVSFSVIPIPDAEGLTLTVNGQDVTDGLLSMVPGEVAQIFTQIMPEDAEQSVTFKKFGNCISVSNDGLVTALSSGTAYIEVSSVDNPSITAQLEVYVRVLPESVQISGETTVDEGGSSTLTATVLPENADDRTVSWKSSNESVAPVTAGGVVTGVSYGTAQIIATANGDPTVQAAITFTVRRPLVVYFNGNGGTPSTPNKTVYYNSTYGDLPTATRTGHSFMGWYTAASGGSKVQNTTSVTATSNHTLYAQWYPISYTYSIVYRSSNGTALGTSTATYNYGTTNTIYPPEKAGYTTPAAQTVAWDSTSAKTITFTYTPIEQPSPQSLFSGTWWTSSSGSGAKVTFAVTGAWRNRTADSVEIQITWKQTINKGYYGYTQKFNAKFLYNGSNLANTGDVTICTSTTWPSSSSPNKGTVTKTSSWITVPINTAGPAAVTVEARYWDADAGSRTISGTMNIPAY